MTQCGRFSCIAASSSGLVSAPSKIATARWRDEELRLLRAQAQEDGSAEKSVMVVMSVSMTQQEQRAVSLESKRGAVGWPSPRDKAELRRRCAWCRVLYSRKTVTSTEESVRN